jgi:hypothetical protein
MKYGISLGLAVISFYAHAQVPEGNQGRDSSYHQFVPRQIMINLSPIIPDRGRYFYEGRRVRFEEVVLPLISINDVIVNRRLEVVRTLTDVYKAIFYAEIGYILFIETNAAAGHARLRYSKVLVTFIGMLVFDELYKLAILIAKKKTIDRYNEVVLQPSFSLGQRGGPTLGLNIRF